MSDVKMNFEVCFVVQVAASSPEQAAKIARDMTLDPDTPLHADVLAFEYYEPAEAWFPCEDNGVSAYFGDQKAGHYRQTYGGGLEPFKGSGVRPVQCVAYRRL